jgi:uncharacterized protein YbaR (Trm112 family)
MSFDWKFDKYIPPHLHVVTDVEKIRAEDPRLSPFAENGCLYCKNCGEHYNMMETVSYNIALGIYKGFILDHKKCIRRS